MEQDEGAGTGAAHCLPPCAKVEGWTRWDVGNGSLLFLAAALPALGPALACKTLLILLLFRDFLPQYCLGAPFHHKRGQDGVVPMGVPSPVSTRVVQDKQHRGFGQGLRIWEGI